jgi:hydrogenase 3 maturation protease
VVGIGNELNGDDAAGILAAQKIWAGCQIPANCLSIVAGSIPENASGPLRKFGPDLVIFIDAADSGQTAGTISWLSEDSIGGFSASSHTLPLTVLGQFLRNELGCQVVYMGIQPLSIEYLEEVSPQVENAVNQVVETLQTILTECN